MQRFHFEGILGWVTKDLAKVAIGLAAAAGLVVTLVVSALPTAQQAAPDSQSAHAAPAQKPVPANKPHITSHDLTGGTIGTQTGPRPAGSVLAPSSIKANCKVDESVAIQDFLESLPIGSVWYSPPGACYLINKGIDMSFPHGVTVDGGTFKEVWLGWLGRRAFNVLGGTNITFENLTIIGPNVSDVWEPQRAFQGGIELLGTDIARIENVEIDNVFGDGITLNPLRGSADHNSGRIVRPVENLTINHVYVDGAGRQGISPVSVTNAVMTDIRLKNVKMNAFDFETDQGNEGAENVTINGCQVSNVGSLANIAGNAGFMGPITVENCVMDTLDGGTAVYVRSQSRGIEHGLVLFTDDALRCQTRAPVACVQMVDANNFALTNSTVTFGPGETPTENVFTAADKTHAQFNDDVVSNYGRLGTKDSTSTVKINDGVWTKGD